MRKLIAFAIGMTLASWTGAVVAHEGEDHGVAGHKAMGTVTAVHKDMNHVEIKDRDGKVVAITVNDKTKYTQGKTAATLDDLKVGRRVVITLAGEGEAKVATEVRISEGTGAAAKPAASDKEESHSGHKH